MEITKKNATHKRRQVAKTNSSIRAASSGVRPLDAVARLLDVDDPCRGQAPPQFVFVLVTEDGVGPHAPHQQERHGERSQGFHSPAKSVAPSTCLRAHVLLADSLRG